jgi:hypothetical protein
MSKITVLTSLLVMTLFLILPNTIYAETYTETFPDPLSQWLSGWFYTNTNAENLYTASGTCDPDYRGNQPEGIWISDDRGCGTIVRQSPVRIDFQNNFGDDATSFSIDQFTCVYGVTFNIYDKDGTLAVSDPLPWDCWNWTTYTYNLTNGISAFEYEYTGSNVEGNTSIDNVTLEVMSGPVCDIKANGSDGPLTISPFDTLSLTIGLNAGDSAGDNADWWVVCDTPYDWFYYNLSSGWSPGIAVTYQGPLFDLGSYEVMNMSLPAGDYTCYFGVDMNMNGSLDMGEIYYDSVEVDIISTVTFEKIYGGSGEDRGHSVQQTADGGYITAGTTTSYGAGQYDVYLLKTDADGNKTWEKTFGGSSYDFAESVEQTTDGGYIVTGHTQSSGAGGYDVYLIKTDADGNKTWEKTFGGPKWDQSRSVQQTSDGGYIISGNTESYGSGATDVYLIKTDSAGNLVWEKTFGGAGSDYGRSVQQTSDGGYIIAGMTRDFDTGNIDVYLIKTDAGGNKTWEKTFGGTDEDRAREVRQTKDGGYIIAGETYSFGAGSYDVYLIKTASNGNKTWQKTFGGASLDSAHSVKQTSDSGYIIAGAERSFSADIQDAYLIKTDTDGNLIWDRSFSGTSLDRFTSVQQTTDSGYIIAGYSDSSGSGRDVYLVKTDSNGNTQ